MLRPFVFLLLTFYCQLAFSQKIDQKKLDNEISKLNNEHQYENAIIKLQSIINDKKSDHYDRYNAYLQKYLTYKRLYNYSEASNNLDMALEEGVLSEHKTEAETRVFIEKIFINFDLQKFDEVEKLLPNVRSENIHLVPADTRAFYISVIATMDLRKDHLKSAEDKLDEAIVILLKDDPKHLPNIYRKKVALYDKMKQPKKAIDAYEKGLYYAEKYNIDIYKIIMYETITKYYVSNKDYKNALYYQNIVSEKRTKYNAANQSGKLNILEKKIISDKKNLELKNEKNVRIFLTVVAALFFALILILLKLFKIKKQQQILIEKENIWMRNELKKHTETKEGKLDLNKHSLTTRQIEIINLVKEGKTNKEIGNILFISENTVKYHLKIIYEILNIGHRSELK